jgi:hypothetical protein
MIRFFFLNFLCLLLLATPSTHAQVKTDPFLEELLNTNASPFLKNVLQNKDTFQYQIIYTQIDRNRRNQPTFRHYYLNVDRNRYFNPASTVKLPTVLAAFEKLNDLKIKGVDKYTAMLTDSAYSGQSPVISDTSSADGLPSVAHYVKKVFLVSDNDAYNRLYEFVGQQTLNETIWHKGYTDTRITRRFVPMTPEENRHTNPVRFVKNEQVVYQQPAQYSTVPFDFSKPIRIGRAHYNREEKLVPEPMDFTQHNNLPLEDLQQMLQSVLFPRSVPRKQRFRLSKDDYCFLYRYMAMLPSQSRFPNYDTTEFFDSYTKFLFKDRKSKIPSHLRIFNKTGWSYGFLTDASYVIDLENKVEYMITAVIYVNKDRVLNDNKYEYTEVGYPFFGELGRILYQHELARKRKHLPDFKRFCY